MSPTDVVRIPILRLGIVNAHLIRSPRGCILVDTGIRGSERRIGRVLARLGSSFADTKLIVVTHAHTDHAGSAARLRSLSSAPILAHKADADFFCRKRPMTFCPIGLVGRLFLRTPAPHQPYEGFVPDLRMRGGGEISLAEFGVDGIVHRASGHTPNSVVVERVSHEALVGDLIASGLLIGGIAFTGRPIRPPFEDDAKRVSRELKGLVHRGVSRFHMSHGGLLGVAEVMRHVGSRPKPMPHRCAAGECGHA